MKRTRAGTTLIEVVIAVSLLSLLMAGVMTSLRLGLSALGRTNTKLMANRRVAGAQQVLREELEGFMPVVALYSPAPEAPPTTKAQFFQGEPQSMRSCIFADLTLGVSFLVFDRAKIKSNHTSRAVPFSTTVFESIFKTYVLPESTGIQRSC